MESTPNSSSSDQRSKLGLTDWLSELKSDGAKTVGPTSVMSGPGLGASSPAGTPKTLVFPDRVVVKVQVAEEHLGAAILIHALSRGMEELSKMGRPDWSSLSMSIRAHSIPDGETDYSSYDVVVSGDVVDHDVPFLKDAGTHARLNRAARL